MSVSNYYATLLFLIKGHSKQLLLHRPEVTLNQIFFYLALKNVISEQFLICLWIF